MSAVSYVNKLGGTKSKDLNTLMKKIWQWCQDKKICLTAEHLPGTQNVIADWYSRNVNDSSDWALDRDIFLQIQKLVGNLEVDLFASRLNHQLDKYVSWKPDPMSWATDAFLLCWKEIQGYAFPPFAMIGRCLAKTMKDKAILTLIAPIWQAQPWYPLILQMLIRDPIRLPNFPALLKSPLGEIHPLTQTGSLNLGVWIISGQTHLQQNYQEQLQHCTKRLGDQALKSLTKAPGENGAAGVINNHLIPFTPLWPI